MSTPPKITRLGPRPFDAASIVQQSRYEEEETERRDDESDPVESDPEMKDVLAPKAARTTIFVIGGALAAVAALTLVSLLVNSIMDYKMTGMTPPDAPPPTTTAAPSAPPPTTTAERRQDELAAAQKKLGDALLKLNMQSAPSPSPAVAEPPPPAAPAPQRTEAPAPAPVAPPTAPPPTVTADEVSRALMRASSLIREGQVASARSLLEHVSVSNDPSVAFALAETYDPKTLARWRALGITGDAERARALYKAALDGGVAEARQRLDAIER